MLQGRGTGGIACSAGEPRRSAALKAAAGARPRAEHAKRAQGLERENGGVAWAHTGKPTHPRYGRDELPGGLRDAVPEGEERDGANLEQPDSGEAGGAPCRTRRPPRRGRRPPFRLPDETNLKLRAISTSSAKASDAAGYRCRLWRAPRWTAISCSAACRQHRIDGIWPPAVGRHLRRERDQAGMTPTRGRGANRRGLRIVQAVPASHSRGRSPTRQLLDGMQRRANARTRERAEVPGPRHREAEPAWGVSAVARRVPCISACSGLWTCTTGWHAT